MNGKMFGLFVGLLTFVCLLSSCYYSPPPVVVITPASPPVGPSVSTYANPAEEQHRTPGEVTPPFTTQRGNCAEFVSGSSDLCVWSWSNPKCPVPLNSCRNLTGKCATPPTSNPPPC